MNSAKRQRLRNAERSAAKLEERAGRIADGTAGNRERMTADIAKRRARTVSGLRAGRRPDGGAVVPPADAVPGGDAVQATDEPEPEDKPPAGWMRTRVGLKRRYVDPDFPAQASGGGQPGQMPTVASTADSDETSAPRNTRVKR